MNAYYCQVQWIHGQVQWIDCGVLSSVLTWPVFLTQAFSKQSGESFQEDEAPFVVKNRLGMPVSVLYSEMFSPIGRVGFDHTVELQDGESLNMDYKRTTTDSDQFSAMTSLSAKDYYIQPSKYY